MAEIRALPWNGLNAISTFSGCGGSSTGYRMAGFRILYANEFIPAARDVYAANQAPYTFLDGRDIRQVTSADILDKVGLRSGELDLLDGSPPCASFSTMGMREKGWGKIKTYSDTTQRADDLFFEFARLLREIQPKTFVAENVSGLVKGSVKGYFLEILATLKACGYQVSAKLLSAAWLGVPQARERLIFVGVRADLQREPVFPKPLPYWYSLRDALNECAPDLYTPLGGDLAAFYWQQRPGERRADAGIRLGIKKGGTGKVRLAWNRPAPTITTAADAWHPDEARPLAISELKRVCSFPDDFVLNGSYSKQYERLGRAVPPVMMSHIAAAVRDSILRIL